MFFKKVHYIKNMDNTNKKIDKKEDESKKLYKKEIAKMMIFCMVKSNGDIHAALSCAKYLLNYTRTEHENSTQFTQDEIRKEHYKNSEIYFVIINRIGRVIKNELDYEDSDIDYAILKGLKDYSFETFKKEIPKNNKIKSQENIKIIMQAIEDVQPLIDTYITKNDEE